MDELIQLVAQYGVAIAISLYLVYWITNHLSSKLDSIESKLEEIRVLLEKLLEEIKRG